VPTASVASVTSEEVTPGATLATLARFAPFARALGAGRSLARDDRGFSLPAPAALAGAAAVFAMHARFPRGLEATSPAHSDGPLHLAVGDDDFFVDVRAEGTAVAGVAEGGAVVYANAGRSTDVVHVVERDSVEELRLLNDASAPTVARYRLTVGRGVASMRLREGRLELLDARGFVRLATAPMFAVDARGQTRPLVPTLDGDVLAVSLDAAGLTYPIAVDPLWTTKPPMARARVGHVAVALPSGNVVVACGTTSTAIEIFDSTANTWSSGGALGAARSSCWGFLIKSGVRAGKIFLFDTASSELYDPVAKTRTAGPVPNGHGTNAIQLTDGRILKAGGAFGAAPYSTEIYDPATNLWTDAGSFPKNYGSRVGAVALAGGNGLFMGGTGNGAFTPGSDDATSYRWNGAWAATTTMLNAPRSSFGLGTLLDGRVLLSGGMYICSGPCASSPLATAEIFTPSTNSWTSTTAMAVTRVNPSQTTLLSGKVLVAGGANALYTTTAGFTVYPSAELFDPAASSWTTISPMSVARRNHVATLLADGSVLVTGGDDGAATPNALASVERFAQYATGQACAAPSGFECTSGFCVNSTCCSTASCAAGYTCNTPLKKGTCARPQGTTCGGDAECETGHCVDGVCCDTACTGVCASCKLATKVGTCSAVGGAPASGHGSCPAGTDTCSAQTCDGADAAACHFPTSTAVCGTKACSAGVETHQSKCDGAGKCSDVAVGCGAYVCNASAAACYTKCTASTACTAGYYCDTASSTCVPQLGLGKACSLSAPCASPLACVDGVCCGTTSCPTGSSCGVVGKEGACTKLPGTPCASAAECGTGFCADSVCCNSACGGICEACDVAGSAGTCNPVLGAPHPGRSACPSDPGNPCSVSSCDGTDRASCAAKAGSSVVCRAAGCVDGATTAQAFCAGDGTCPAAVTSSCNGYVCDVHALACRTS
jgi:hypothetical protein